MATQKKAPVKFIEITFEGRSYRKYNCQDLVELLLYYDWSSYYRLNDPNEQ